LNSFFSSKLVHSDYEYMLERSRSQEGMI
jgi:hypothetical protein